MEGVEGTVQAVIKQQPYAIVLISGEVLQCTSKPAVHASGRPVVRTGWWWTNARPGTNAKLPGAEEITIALYSTMQTRLVIAHDGGKGEFTIRGQLAVPEGQKVTLFGVKGPGYDTVHYACVNASDGTVIAFADAALVGQSFDIFPRDYCTPVLSVLIVLSAILGGRYQEWPVLFYGGLGLLALGAYFCWRMINTNRTLYRAIRSLMDRGLAEAGPNPGRP